MKSPLICAMIFISVVPGLTQEKPDSSKSLQEIVVKETYKANLEEEKIPVYITTDFGDLIQIPERIHWSSLNSQGKKHNNGEKWQDFSFALSSPQCAHIRPQPIKVFHAQFSDISGWEMSIFSSDGKLFRTMAAEGNPPESIVWDGLGNDGNFLVPGHNYSYSFTAVDKAGNKRTFPGQTFSIPAVYFQTGDSLWVGIAAAKIFSSDGFGLLQTAEEYSKEVASLIRYYCRKGQVVIEGSNAQQDKFVQQVAANLNMEPGFIRQRKSGQKNRESMVIWIR